MSIKVWGYIGTVSSPNMITVAKQTENTGRTRDTDNDSVIKCDVKLPPPSTYKHKDRVFINFNLRLSPGVRVFYDLAGFTCKQKAKIH